MCGGEGEWNARMVARAERRRRKWAGAPHETPIAHLLKPLVRSAHPRAAINVLVEDGVKDGLAARAPARAPVQLEPRVVVLGHGLHASVPVAHAGNEAQAHAVGGAGKAHPVAAGQLLQHQYAPHLVCNLDGARDDVAQEAAHNAGPPPPSSVASRSRPTAPPLALSSSSASAAAAAAAASALSRSKSVGGAKNTSRRSRTLAAKRTLSSLK